MNKTLYFSMLRRQLDCVKLNFKVRILLNFDENGTHNVWLSSDEEGRRGGPIENHCTEYFSSFFLVSALFSHKRKFIY